MKLSQVFLDFWKNRIVIVNRIIEEPESVEQERDEAEKEKQVIVAVKVEF